MDGCSAAPFTLNFGEVLAAIIGSIGLVIQQIRIFGSTDVVHSVYSSFFVIRRRFQHPAGAIQFREEGLLIRQRGAVFGGEHLVGQRVEGVMDDGLILLGAEDDADGRVLVGVRPVLLGIGEIEMHLARVGVGELAEFPVNDDQASEPSVVEQQVDPIPLVADAEPALAADEREVAAELQQEGLQVLDQGFLQLALGVLVLQSQEFEDQRILDLLLGREDVFRPRLCPLRSIAALFREASVRS